MPPDLAQAYGFGPLYSSGDYGANSTVAILEMSGAGFSKSDITGTFANCYGDPARPSTRSRETDIDGGGTTGGRHVGGAELDIETVLVAGTARRTSRSTRAASSDNLATPSSTRIINDDTAKIVSASWTNGCEAYVGQSVQEFGEHAVPGGGSRGGAVEPLCRLGRPGRAGLQHQRLDRGDDGHQPRRPGRRRVDRNPLHCQQVEQHRERGRRGDSTSNPHELQHEGARCPPARASGPDAVALDAAAGKVFVANTNSTSDRRPHRHMQPGHHDRVRLAHTQIASNGHLSAPAALAVSGSTLSTWRSSERHRRRLQRHDQCLHGTSVTASTVRTVPTALAVDSTNGFVYVADGANNRIEYFDASTCNATTTSYVLGAVPSIVAVGHDPVALTVSAGAGNLYVANAGAGGGISVISLSTRAPLWPCRPSPPRRALQRHRGRTSPSACHRTATESWRSFSGRTSPGT